MKNRVELFWLQCIERLLSDWRDRIVLCDNCHVSKCHLFPSSPLMKNSVSVSEREEVKAIGLLFDLIRLLLEAPLPDESLVCLNKVQLLLLFVIKDLLLVK